MRRRVVGWATCLAPMTDRSRRQSRSPLLRRQQLRRPHPLHRHSSTGAIWEGKTTSRPSKIRQDAARASPLGPLLPLRALCGSRVTRQALLLTSPRLICFSAMGQTPAQVAAPTEAGGRTRRSIHSRLAWSARLAFQILTLISPATFALGGGTVSPRFPGGIPSTARPT